MGRVEGKVAVVTGGAKGIGAECARLLAREGAKVLLTDIDGEGGAAVVSEIRGSGGSAAFMLQDVTDEALWPKVFAAAAAFGPVTTLVNNAGIGRAQSVEATSLADWRQTIAINLDAVFLGTKYAIEWMKHNPGSSIINISSIEGLVANPVLASYNASKGGVRLFSKSAALHCCAAGYPIRVNSVHPGFVWTPLVEQFLRELGDVDSGREATTKLHPIGRLGTPADIAYGVLYLASDESSFVTGSELVIDGGFTAQ